MANTVLDPADRTLVHAAEVSRVYQQGTSEVRAVHEANCVVHPGDRIAIVGPSGSGKSTLLHLLGGLDTPTAGTVRWPALGERETLRPRLVSVVFQSRSLVDALTAAENVAVPLVLLGEEPEDALRKSRGTLEMMELEYIADRLPEELSGGQAQRVALARAIVTEPRLLLADEPTGQLDHLTARALFNTLFEILDRTDTAVILTTHDSTIAERMQHRWRVRHGELEVV